MNVCSKNEGIRSDVSQFCSSMCNEAQKPSDERGKSCVDESLPYPQHLDVEMFASGLAVSTVKQVAQLVGVAEYSGYRSSYSQSGGTGFDPGKRSTC